MGCCASNVYTLEKTKYSVDAVASYTTQAGAPRVVSGGWPPKIWDPGRRRLLAKLKGHTNAVNLAGNKMCEDCGFKHASFGSKVDRKVRWCGSCVKANGHTGAMIIGVKICEDCKDKQATFGVKADKVREQT